MPPFHLVSEPWLLHLAATYGAWAVFASVAVESTGLPVPSESILIAVAVLVAAGDNGQASAVLPVVLAAVAGAVLGDNLGYGIGRKVGPSVLRRIGLAPRHQRLGRYLFLRYGGRIVFIARFVSVLRTCVSLLAGTTRMPWPRFLAYNALGATVWAGAVGFGAYALGQRARTWSWTASLAFGVLAVVVVGAGAIVLRRKEAALQAEADAASPNAT